MNHQVFISSYAADYPFLIHNLVSLRRFSRGFLHPVVCVEPQDFESCATIVAQSYPEARVEAKEARPGQGFMGAQIRMMKSDLLCPGADVLYFLGSDCLACDTFTPEQYIDGDGKPIVLYRAYDRLEPLIWRAGTARVLGFDPANEYMGRLPTVLPRSIFAPMRVHVEKIHNMEFENYIYTADALHHDTSEANILGAFAHRFMPGTCCFVDALDVAKNPHPAKSWAYPILQCWSHGGLDRPMEASLEYRPGKNSVGQTPRAVFNEVLYGL